MKYSCFNNRGWPFQFPPTSVPFVINKNSTQSNGLILWYPPRYDCLTTSKFYDLSYKGHDASNNGNKVTWVKKEPFGQVLYFDGASHLEVTHSASLNIQYTSIAVWAYFTSLASGGFHTIVSKQDSGAPYDPFDLRRVDSDMQFSASSSTTEYQAAASGFSISVNVWYHFVGVFDGDNTHIYINGVLNNTNTSPSGAVLGTTTANLGIGENPTFTGRYHEGYMHDLRIYDRALSPVEIQRIYNPATRWELYKPLIPIFQNGSAPTAAGEANIQQMIFT